MACSGGGDFEDATLDTKLDTASYAIGNSIGRSMSAQGVEANLPVLFKGLHDAYNNGEIMLSDSVLRAVLQQTQAEASQRQQADAMRQAEVNQFAGETFLEENAKKDDIVVLESGLQYRVIKEGEGASPASDQEVSVHYTGKLLDGTVFDSSVERGQPATFNLNRVIRGWTEALQLMQVGDKWELFVPSHLAYGRRGSGDKIPPNTTLIFEVELLGMD
ncbi:MAG: FKBP-type peptidyl-prolyl cis-trans isomerase [Candidatus Marinimicrobia bacterium]|nr:FKBP-type peptidyl-prolyl cis-trans isomerase [Candidatus Neomarinimicrobiota bacterium]